MTVKFKDFMALDFPHIVFLLNDGALFPEKISYWFRNNSDSMLKDLDCSLINYWKAGGIMCAMLNNLYELRDSIVVTSVWADYHNKEQLDLDGN